MTNWLIQIQRALSQCSWGASLSYLPVMTRLRYKHAMMPFRVVQSHKSFQKPIEPFPIIFNFDFEIFSDKNLTDCSDADSEFVSQLHATHFHKFSVCLEQPGWCFQSSIMKHEMHTDRSFSPVLIGVKVYVVHLTSSVYRQIEHLSNHRDFFKQLLHWVLQCLNHSTQHSAWS